MLSHCFCSMAMHALFPEAPEHIRSELVEVEAIILEQTESASIAAGGLTPRKLLKRYFCTG